MFLPVRDDVLATPAVELQPGNGQAPLLAVLLLVGREVQHRVDQVPGLLLVEVGRRHA